MYNMDNQDSFKKYLFNFIRGGFIIGCVFTLLALVNGASMGEVTIFAWNTKLTGLLGILFLIVVGPLYTAFIGLILGLIYYALGRLIRACFQFLSHL